MGGPSGVEQGPCLRGALGLFGGQTLKQHGHVGLPMGEGPGANRFWVGAG